MPPVSVATVSGHLHYYRYRAASAFEWWELAELLARWRRVPRRLPGDGSGRPMWLAMRRAVAAGQIDVLSPSLDHGAPIGIRILVHPTAQGPYSLGFAATAGGLRKPRRRDRDVMEASLAGRSPLGWRSGCCR